MPVAAIGGLYLLIWRRRALLRPQLWQAAATAVGVALLITYPFYAPFFALEAEMYQITKNLAAFAWEFSADLLSWVLPSGDHPFWGRLTGPIYRQFTTPNLMETTVFIGYIPLALAVASLFVKRFRPQIYFWQMLALCALLLSFGPILHLQGQPISDWMPFRVFMALPGFESFRIPSRIGITVALAASILTVMVLAVWQSRRPAWPWTTILVAASAILLFNTAFDFPYQSADTRIPALYASLREEADPSALLELPAGEFWQANRNYFGEVSWYMYYQTQHQRPLVSGYLGRRPARLHQQERELPFVKRFFFDNDEGKPLVDFPDDAALLSGGWPEDARLAPQILQELGIGDVLLHCQPGTGPYCRPARSLLHRSLGPPIKQEADALLYPVDPPNYHVRDASELVEVALLEGVGVVNLADEEYGLRQTIEESAAFTFHLPISGVWSLRGEWIGGLADEPRFILDGAEVAPTVTAYSDWSTGFSAAVALEAGEHLIEVLPRGAGADAQCDAFCLRFVVMHLEATTAERAAQPVATFVNEPGDQFTLLAARLLTSEDGRCRRATGPSIADRMGGVHRLPTGARQCFHANPIHPHHRPQRRENLRPGRSHFVRTGSARSRWRPLLRFGRIVPRGHAVARCHGQDRALVSGSRTLFLGDGSNPRR
ncbi:MAG: hypothetical protein HC802_04690 [Caldilineaceae bacterium]|nr:hypothetical protein [Caldilineaceae bacterium]